MNLLPESGAAVGDIRVRYKDEEGSHDVDMSHYNAKEMQRYRGAELAMVFQEPMSSLNPSMRIRKQMAEMLTHSEKGFEQKDIEEKLRNALLEVDLTDTDRILSKITFTDAFHDVRKLAAAHHEYLDGSGYPNGATADSLPLEVRIMTISDI